MSSSSEAEDEGPFALQLQKWQEGSVKIELSEFSKGFISPTRRILLLLSKKHEAVLLSLIPGKISETESRRLPIFESSPVISGVKSLAWGSFPDSSAELETSSFEQLLIVSNTRGIFVHIFCSVQPTETDLKLTDGESKGKWIDWGPNKELDASSSDMKKNWLRTFCAETESTVQNGKFLTNFPSEKTLPSYANVVSFDIYGAILSFLESKEGFCGTGYECSRVFSSPNNQFIGFVLKFEENAGTDVSYRFMVVVMRIYKWGFEWVFSVDPYRFETGTELEEVQLSEDFLFCLDGSGLVTFWDLNSGNFVTQFNVLNSRKSGFKRILVASNSKLLGIIDQFGVVYLVALDEILTKKNGILSKYHYNGTLTAWTIAGNDIGSLIYRSNIPNSQSLDDFEAIRPSKRRKYNNIKNKGLKPIRKVYLPPYRAKDETETLVCLSPFGITRLVKNNDFNSTKIIHTDLHVGPTKTRESLFERESIGCFFKGCLYLITQEGISVILPSISISNRGENCVKIDDLGFGGNWKPWQIEVLDRVILYEGPKEADQLCLDNRWDLRFSRMRQMQLALHYSKFDEIEQCLNMLVDVNLAEEGVLRLLVASVYQIFVRVSSENEVAMSSRLIALAARFATKVIHKYALIDQKKGSAVYSRRLDEMAFFLEVIRDLQSRVSAKSKKLSETADEMDSMDPESLPTDSSPAENNNTNINSNNRNNDNNNNNLSLTLTESSSPNQSIEPTQLKRIIIAENVRDMMARWELSNFDLKNVVRDALKSGRLPLAVLQLQLLRQKHAELAVPDSLDERLGGDTFGEVRGIGRSIAYDLFIRGETELAVETLERLGEDMESVLRQLLFGTVRRSLRQNIAIEMKRHGFLRPNEMKILDRISLVEKLYPRSNFWGTYNKTKENPSETNDDSTPQLALHILDNSPVLCGELDGAILGIWSDISSSSASSSHENSDEVSSDGYWACALVWSDAWDQRTIDRILLDRPYQTGILVPWESQFEYHIAHNNSQEILNLIDIIPSSLISEGILTINTENSTLIPNNGLYICANEEIEPSYLEIPNVNILKHFNSDKCTLYLRTLIEGEFAKRNIFIRDYWNNVGDLIQVIARAGLIFDFSEINESNEKSLEIIEFLEDSDGDVKSKEGFYKLLVHYCVQNDLPYLLDFYLDQWNLVQDHRSLNLLMDATGDCEWAKWLLFSALKGYEYESSFSNARWKLNVSPGNSLQLEGRLRTPDDFFTEGLGEMAALATLMYNTIPIERCLSVESLNGPGLRKYSTIWQSLVSACSGGDSYGSLSFNANKVFGKSVLSDYLNWRYGIFASSGGDSSLLQILPFTLPISVRRLVQLFIQGTFGMQSLADATQMLKESDESHLHGIRKTILNAIGTNCSNPTSLEASVQKIVQMELFPVEENVFKVENYLNRGRVLSALNDMIKERATELNSTILRNDPSVQPNINWDTRLILGPLNQTEKSTLLLVIPLAITNFNDSSLVASSAFFFELCGVSFDMIRLDINALKRISSHYNQSNNQTLTLTLARELAEDYLKSDYLQIITQNPNISKYAPFSKVLVSILHHLEKASLPVMQEGQSCGFWLKNGNGDYSVIREKQSEQSKKWNLVTEFCQMHNLPLSTKYLAFLANDNDWVGFLTEAQLGGFSADVIIQVASKEIRDTRLRTHVLTVLKNMQSTKKKANDEVYIEEENDTPAELFAVIAGCEKQKCPGEALLRKARDLCWPLLAIVASCFNDTSPLSCLTVWLEITASKSGLIKVDKDKSSEEISRAVGSAVESTNKLLSEDLKTIEIHYNRQNTKRQRISGATCNSPVTSSSRTSSSSSSSPGTSAMQNPILDTGPQEVVTDERDKLEEELSSLSDMVAMLCGKQLFLPLLRALEMFLPSFSLLPFIRSLQAFSQMRLSEASAHLASFSARIKEDPSSSSSSSSLTHLNRGPWLSNTAVKAGESVLATCPSLYEKRCLLELLSSADFGDGGGSAAYFGRLYWKITRSGEEGEGERLAELEDGEMLGELERMGRWDEAREWARQLEAVSPAWKSAFHHATESQAEAMVSEWKEFLWDFPQERAALWGHCQALFVRYSFPPLQAGLFFLKHAEAIEKEIPARELHEVLLFALQWLSGTITQVPPVYPLHLLREIETRVWLLAVESETESKSEPDFSPSSSVQTLIPKSSSSPIEQTAFIISKMDAHINSTRVVRPAFSRDTLTTKSKKKGKSSYLHLRRASTENIDNNTDISSDEYEVGVSNWEERVGPVEMERAVLSLLEFGQISAAKQLQQKLSPAHVPDELTLIDAALKLAKFSSSSGGCEISLSVLDESVRSVVRSLDLPIDSNMIDPSKALEALTLKCGEGRGRGLCKRVIAVVRAARVLGLGFSVAFAKQPIELLQLLSLKAQDSFEEAKLLVRTHSMPAASIAHILTESFFKGLQAAYYGGCIESTGEEGPAPLLWRSRDFLKWAELCPSEPEIGHALMRLVMTGQDFPHACEVELLILAHHFYTSSACLDGISVLVTFAANRVESYVSESDFPCLARLITGVTNFHSLSFILDILIENSRLELLLQKYSAAAEAATGSAAAVRGFRMAVLTALKRFSPRDLDALAMVYNHFDMKHEAATLLDSRATTHIAHWSNLPSRDRQNRPDLLLAAMRHLIEASETLSSIDAGLRTHSTCAKASLLTLQTRIPDVDWVGLEDREARELLEKQVRFQEAVVVAQGYGIQPAEWARVFWNLMSKCKPDLVERFVAEFVAVFPLQPSMLQELARIYRSDVTAKGDQSHFGGWLNPTGLPAFRSVLKRTRDLKVRMQIATMATGFKDVVEACAKLLDKVPENAGPLVLRRGHGGAYLPLM